MVAAVSCLSCFALVVLVLLQTVCCSDIISTIAGTGSTGYTGDGIAATSATLYYPTGVVFDSSGRVTILVICIVFCRILSDFSYYYPVHYRQRVHR